MIRGCYALFVIFLISSFPNFCAADFKQIAGWDSQLFPSYLVSTASLKKEVEEQAELLGDPFGMLGVELTAKRSRQQIRVTITCDGFSEPSEFVGVLPTAGTTYRIYPKMRFKFDKLINCKQAIPVSVSYSVKIGNSQEENQTGTITMRAINDCPFGVIVGEEMAPMNLSFAAYVNEQHPFVDKLLKEALQVGMVRSFTGYQSGDPNQAIRQVYAIWDLMVSREMKYSNITATASLSTQVRSQHVRLVEETINNTQANCVDGTVLFASILRKIGIDAGLIITSNHCYLAFWADSEHKLLYGLETTLMGEDLSEASALEMYDDVIATDTRWEYSWTSFTHGLAIGTQNLQKELDKEEREFAFVDITAARLNGVLPIPFNGSEIFTPTEFHFTDVEESESDSIAAEDIAEEDIESSWGEETEESEDITWDDTIRKSASSKKSLNKKKAVKAKQPQSGLSWE